MGTIIIRCTNKLIPENYDSMFIVCMVDVLIMTKLYNRWVYWFFNHNDYDYS